MSRAENLKKEKKNRKKNKKQEKNKKKHESENLNEIDNDFEESIEENIEELDSQANDDIDEEIINKKEKKKKDKIEKKASKESKKERKKIEKEERKKERVVAKRFCIFLIVLLLLVFLSAAAYFIYNNFIKVEPPIISKMRLEFDKVRLKTVDLNSNVRPYAVMIDNNEGAWPQFNVNEAMVVYEMLVEGGLSRIMAIYKDKPKLEKIGPLRSSRHYFLDYVKEYDAIYAHEGKSPRAALELRTRKIDTIEYTTGLFYRDLTRWAPHNAISSGERMINAAKLNKFSLKTKTKPPLKYSRTEVKLDKPISATTIETGFSDYVTLKLKYNEKTKKYEKYEIGELLKDAVTKKPLAATNILILYGSYSPLTGFGAGKNRVDIDTTKIKSGYYFTHGEGVKIKASKATINSKTKYTLEDGIELKINDGNTFIFIVPSSRKVNIKGTKKDKNQEQEPEIIEEITPEDMLEELTKDKKIKIIRDEAI